MTSSRSQAPRDVLLPGMAPLRALSWGLDGDPPSPPGDGKVAVLLHGMGDGAGVWQAMIKNWPPAGPPLPCLALDLPGHGGSARLAPGRYRIGEVARSIAGVLAELSFDSPILIGHSVGARLILHAAGRGLIKPRASILIDANPDPNPQADAAVVAHMEALRGGASDLGSLAELVRARMPLADAAVTRDVIQALARQSPRGWHLPIDPAAKQLLERSDGDEWGLLAAIPGPVGIVRGAFSSILSKPAAARMVETAPQAAPVEMIMRAGHAILFEQPKVLAETVAQLLTRFGALR